MTKSRDNKQAIRAYMRTHGVNYTTAKRALREQAERNAHIRWAFEQDTDTVHSVTVTNAPSKVVPLITAQRPSDLTARCVCAPDEQHAGHRTDCPERIKLIDAALAATTMTDAPVVLDVARARKSDLFTLPHIHDLDGRCAKNRGGRFCTPTPTADPTLDGGLGTGEPVTPSDADRLRSVARATLNDPAATARIIVGIDPSTDPDNATVVLRRADGHPTDDDPTIDRAARLERSQRILDGVLALTRDHTGPADPTADTTINLRPANYLSRSLILDEVPSEDDTIDTIARLTGLTSDQVRTAVARHDASAATSEMTQIEWQDALWAGAFDTAPSTDRDAGHVPEPSRRDDLHAALRTGNPDILNAHLRAHAPGPHTDDLHAALEQLASLELELREHTSDPESPVTYEMLRHAMLATTTHGERWGGGKWHPTAADVCRSYLLGVHITTGPDTPHIDGQYPAAPEDLAGVLETVAEDDALLESAAEGTAVHVDDIAEELLILANTLDGTLPPTADPTRTLASDDDHHYLVVTTGDRYVDRRYKIECASPTTGRGSCEGWEECSDCSFLGADQWDAILDRGTAHGVEHIMLTNGPAIATGKCALQAFPEAWEDSDAITNLPPGRYAINHKWEDEYATLWLRTH